MPNAETSAFLPHSAIRILRQWFGSFFHGESTTHTKRLKDIDIKGSLKKEPSKTSL